VSEPSRGEWYGKAILAALALAVAGCLGPWIDHDAVGLVLTGLELGEFAKSFPHVMRTLLYMPFAATLSALALLAGEIMCSRARFLAPVLCAALLLASVFPYSFVTSAYDALTAGAPLTVDSRYTGQAIVASVGAVVALLAPLMWRLPERARSLVLAMLSAGGAGLGLWQYAVLLPSVTATYGRPASLGWGLFACSAGLAAAAGVAVLRIFRPGVTAEGES
jgi:hypothetical protein